MPKPRPQKPFTTIDPGLAGKVMSGPQLPRSTFCLANYCWGLRAECHPSLNTIAKAPRLDRANVVRALHVLEKHEMIARTPRSRRLTTVYTLLSGSVTGDTKCCRSRHQKCCHRRHPNQTSQGKQENRRGVIQLSE